MQNVARSLCRQSGILKTLASPSAQVQTLTNPRSQHLAFSPTRPSSSSALWNLGILNHTAIAVPDLQKSVAFYRDVLKADVSEPEDLPDHVVTVVFVNLPNTKIELLYPLGENSPIAGFLQKNKDGGIHHICIEVDDIESAVKHVREMGVRTLGERTKIGAHGKPVMFLHPKDCGGVLTELEQK